MRSGAGGRSAAEKGTDGAEERLRLLNIRHMTAGIQYNELCLERLGGGSRRLEGDRIVPSVYDEGRAMDVTKRVREVEVAQRVPDGLLHAAGHAEWRQRVCGPRVGEVTGDAELELALPVCRRVAFAKSRRSELGTLALHERPGLAACELGLELCAPGA